LGNENVVPEFDVVEERMSHITYCAGCGHGLVPILPEKGRTEPSCFWCEGVDARTMDMAKWADSPSGKPELTARQFLE
jgi:hypothetical protein